MSRLLVVDDETGIHYGFRRIYRGSDVEVRGAETVAEGLALFSRWNPDVVVLDLGLPDGSGLELFEAIRRQSSTVPVIFITADANLQTALTALKQGAFGYLMKPLDLSQLQATLSRAFEVARGCVLGPQEPGLFARSAVVAGN